MNHCRTLLSIGLILACVCLGLTVPALAQGGGPGGGGHGHGYQDGDYMYFDPDTIVTLSGTLETAGWDWNMWGNGNHTGGGMGMSFRADDGEEYDLMLAPIWFLQDSGIVLSQGERITVIASRVEGYDGGYHHGNGPGGGGMMGGYDSDRDFLIVTVLQADGARLELRDDQGYPLWRGGDGWNDHWFDPGTVETLTGTLSESLGLWSVMGYGNHTGNGMHFMFESGADSYYAMLGPWWFLESQGLRLENGQRATITGSVVDSTWSRHGDAPFLIATEIVVGGMTVQLRDEWGYPLWHGTGWHYYSPSWSAGTVGEVTGEVTKIRRRRNGRQLDKGYEVLLRAGGQKYRLFVAPDWDVRDTGMKLRRGDRISVRGSAAGAGGSREMVVQYLDDAAGHRWRFRNGNGEPLWVMGNR